MVDTYRQNAAATGVPAVAPKNIIFLSLCAVGLLLFALLAVNPSVRKAAQLRRELKEAKLEIARQRVLYPLYAGLIIAGEVAELPSGLPCPAKVPLAQERIVGTPAMFAGLAATADIDLAHVSPQVRTLDDGRRFLVVEMMTRGTYVAFRKFLLALGELPSFERVETLELSKTTLGEAMELRAWLAIE